MAINTIHPHLPDLVINQILQLLPTRDVIRITFLSKQWEGVWSSFPILDFDEEDDSVDDDVEHKKFVHILKKSLEFIDDQKETPKPTLHKFRLRMMRYLSTTDSTIVDKWLSFSFERAVKELDLSLKVGKLHWNRAGKFRWITGVNGVEDYYCLCLSQMALFNAKFLTTLKLEYMRIKEDIIPGESKHGITIFPCLKILSLNAVHFNSFYYLIQECPCIEKLSLRSCSFESLLIYIPSSTLKSLQVKHCNVEVLDVREARNLESFTFIASKFPLLDSISLTNSVNLKYVNIHAPDLKKIFLYGCHDSLKARINTRKLVHFDFLNGYLNKSTKVCLTAPKLIMSRILLREIWYEEFRPTSFNWEHFAALRVFLKAFDSSESMVLLCRDFEVLIFPEDFRKTFTYSLLPRLTNLIIYTLNPPTTDASNISDDVWDSLTWMAPCLEREALSILQLQTVPLHLSTYIQAVFRIPQDWIDDQN